jgi:hypothetical protein
VKKAGEEVFMKFKNQAFEFPGKLLKNTSETRVIVPTDMGRRGRLAIRL